MKCRKDAGKEQEKCKRNGEADFMAEDYIWTENMTVGYGKTPLIRQIGIHVRAGEIVTLIGPNGAGKSTILRSVIRQLGLLEGTVYLDGMPMKGMGEREIAKRMSILMTERIHPELMNCEDVVGTGRYPYTGRMGILTAEDRGKVREAMEMVHAWDLASRDFSQISDGQKQRILLARAICQDPSVIVLDEPTSFLDIRHKLELLTILKDLVRRKKVAVLMSLHELDLAQKLSDYIVCVKGEYIERCGTPEEIFTSSYITGLYGITKGSYYAEFGCLEMEPVKGKTHSNSQFFPSVLLPPFAGCIGFCLPLKTVRIDSGCQPLYRPCRQHPSQIIPQSQLLLHLILKDRFEAASDRNFS